jgi:hypothetical protein
MRRDPVSEADYFASPYVASYRGADCTIEIDGACAVLVTSLPRARSRAAGSDDRFVRMVHAPIDSTWGAC